MSQIIMFALACGALGVIYALVTASWVSKQNAGSEKMQQISDAIKEGAIAFLNREYKTVAIVAVVLTALLFFLGKWTAVGFVIGAFGSALAGYIGMMVSVQANVRTTEAAKNGIQAALNVAFKGGSVTGIMVVGLGLLGISGYYLIVKQAAPRRRRLPRVDRFGLRMFAHERIRTYRGRHLHQSRRRWAPTLSARSKRASPKTTPETRPVIADNVGDNVGDCAGMAADLYETYTRNAGRRNAAGQDGFSGPRACGSNFPFSSEAFPSSLRS